MLNRSQIEKLIQDKQLIEGYIDLATQLTPNGFDLTAREICAFHSAGALDFSNKERRLPETGALLPEKNDPRDAHGWWKLGPGGYKVVTNEVVNFPSDLVGIAFPRSSLLRMGAFVHNGVWDAGFRGRSEFILTVQNPAGIRIKQNARILQLVFIPIVSTGCGYQGMYQNLA